MTKMVKLSEVSELTVGYVGTMGKEYIEEGVPFLRSLNIVPYGFDLSDLKFISDSFCKKIKKSRLQFNDVVIVRTGNPGTAAVVTKELDGCNCSDLVIVRPNIKLVNPHYLCAFINSWGKSQIANAKVGAIQKHFNIGSASEMLVPLPDIDTQNKIASIIVVINSKIASNKILSEVLEKMLKLIYDYWFVQFDFPDENGKPYKSSGGKMVWNEELKREIPDEWLVDSIGKFITEREKSTVQVRDAVGHRGKIPFFTSGEEIIMYDTSFATGNNCFLNTGGNADVKYYIGDAAYSTDTWCITAGAYSSYIYEYVDSIRKYLDISFFAGSGLRHLQKEALKKHKIVIPPESLIRKFNETVDKCFTKISEIKIENQSLSELRDFLLPMLMNGQVKLKP